MNLSWIGGDAVRVNMPCLKKSSIRKTIRKNITEQPAVTARIVHWLPVVLVKATRNISG
jgi:hypothetical protein